MVANILKNKVFSAQINTISMIERLRIRIYRSTYAHAQDLKRSIYTSYIHNTSFKSDEL